MKRLLSILAALLSLVVAASHASAAITDITPADLRLKVEVLNLIQHQLADLLDTPGAFIRVNNQTPLNSPDQVQQELKRADYESNHELHAEAWPYDRERPGVKVGVDRGAGALGFSIGITPPPGLTLANPAKICRLIGEKVAAKVPDFGHLLVQLNPVDQCSGATASFNSSGEITVEVTHTPFGTKQ